MSKLTDKETAYRRGRKDERQKLVDLLMTWELNLLEKAKDNRDSPATSHALIIVAEQVELFIKTLGAKL